MLSVVSILGIALVMLISSISFHCFSNSSSIFAVGIFVLVGNLGFSIGFGRVVLTNLSGSKSKIKTMSTTLIFVYLNFTYSIHISLDNMCLCHSIPVNNHHTAADTLELHKRFRLAYSNNVRTCPLLALVLHLRRICLHADNQVLPVDFHPTNWSVSEVF